MTINKKELSERDICTKFITPAIVGVGWKHHQFREEVKLTDGRIEARGPLVHRITDRDKKGGPKFADYVLYAKPNLPIVVVEAKKKQISRRAWYATSTSVCGDA